MFDNLTGKEKAALAAASKAIYFNDSADYLSGLWEVVTAIMGEDFMEKLDDDEDFVKQTAQYFINED
jgi:hypothetical protein